MTPFRAALDDAEVAIVGGGPAGSIAAFTLASAGHDVVLIDKQAFPRDKSCGDGLTSSAVSFLHEVGLDEVLHDAQPVEAARLCVDWAEREVCPMFSRRGSAWSQACCVPRAQLDAALVKVACEAGARLVRGYVTAPLHRDGSVVGVELTHKGVARVITARHVMAADGATSRLRRQLIGPATGELASSFAVRRYMRTGHPLDPVLEVYAPVTDPHVGYGWVFPVSDRLANIGVGYLTARGLPRPRAINALLDSFVGSLQTHRGSKLGSLTPTGAPIGAPIAVGFAADRCEAGGAMFLGDAARTCDPLTFEGIDQAMRSAHSSALALHHAIRRRTRPMGIGREIARSNARLGQDSAMIARLGHELLKARRAQDGSTEVLSAPAPVFSIARSVLTAEVDRPTLAETPAGRTARRLGFAGLLHELDGRMRDEARSEFVFTSELIWRDVCGGMGPVGALMVFASQAACGVRDSDQTVDAALCVELLRVFPTMLGRVTPVSDDQGRANNALAVMTGDYGLSRAFTAAARLGSEYTEMFADAVEASSEAAAVAEQHRPHVSAATRSYLEWAALRSGTSLALAARMGAGLMRRDETVEEMLAIAGEKLGIAVQICEDLLAVTRQDPITGRLPWRVLQEGGFVLPVILAMHDEPSIGSLLHRANERGHWESVLDVMSKTDGFRRAEELCRRYVASAKEAIVVAAGQDVPLIELCDLPVRCLASVAAPPALAPEAPTASPAADRLIAS